MKSTPQQQLILDSDSKRIVVLACPGSGKTAVITQKIIKLVQSGAKLGRILSVTFTRKAAKEMLDRLETEITISRSERKNICTLHSLGCRILYEFHDVVGLQDEYKIALSAEKANIVRQVLPENAEANDIVNSFLDYVSNVKNGIAQNNNYRFTAEQFDTYCAKMIEANLIDLDDYIYLPVTILKNNSYIQSKISERYDYVYVDEYQDINAIQDAFLELLISPSARVLYVGDDDQSIYEFRGSNSNFILEKSGENSGYDVFYLTENFRSQKPIVDLSKKVLTGLDPRGRRDKAIVPHKESSAHKPVRMKFDNKQDEIQFVVDEIYRLITEGYVEPKEIAVLSRYTSKKNEFGKPFHPELEGIENGLSSKGISATQSMSLSADTESAKQIRKLCDTLIALHRGEFLPEYLNLLEGNVYSKEKFNKTISTIDQDYGTHLSDEQSFAAIMDQIIELKPSSSVISFQKRIERYIRSYSFLKEQYDRVQAGALPSEIIVNIMAHMLKNEMAQANSKEIYEYAFSFAKSCEQYYEPGIMETDEYSSVVMSIHEYLCEQEKNSSKNSVRLLTAHQSKGLQFDVVFVVGLEVGSFPCNYETLEGQYYDNERRLFYVSITRARELLYLTATGVVAPNESLSLSDKSFVFNLPATYFDENVGSFSDIPFSTSDKEKLLQLKEKEDIISQLEDDYAKNVEDLQEALKEIEEYKQKEKEWHNNTIATDSIQSLESRIRELLMLRARDRDEIQRMQGNEARSIQSTQAMQLEIRNSKMEIERERQLREVAEAKLEKAQQEAKEASLQRSRAEQVAAVAGQRARDREAEAQRSLEDAERERRLRKAAEMQLASAKEDKRIADSQRSKAEKGTEFAARRLEELQKTVVSAEQQLSKIELVKQTLINAPEYAVSKDMKKKISILYDVFSSNKRFLSLKPSFETGLSVYQDQIDDSIEYLNGKIDSSLFRARVTAHNYKGSLDTLVRKLLEWRVKDYFLDQNREFKIGMFLYAYLNPEDTVSPRAYRDVVRRYKRDPLSVPISDELARNMYTLYAITTTCNHDARFVGNQSYAGEMNWPKEYQEMALRFIENPSPDYFQVFASFFEFIYLYVSGAK